MPIFTCMRHSVVYVMTVQLSESIHIHVYTFSHYIKYKFVTLEALCRTICIALKDNSVYN